MKILVVRYFLVMFDNENFVAAIIIDSVGH